MKFTLFFLLLVYVAAKGQRRRPPRRCGLPTFTSRLPKDVQEKILKIWENYEDGDRCDREYEETKDLIDTLPEEVRARALRPKPPPFLIGVSNDVRRQFDSLWKNFTIPKDEKMEKLKQLSEKLLNKEQRNEFNKFYAEVQRRRKEFQKKVEQLTPEARAAHEKLVKLKEEKRKIFMEASESVRNELSNLYHDNRKRPGKGKRKPSGSSSSE